MEGAYDEHTRGVERKPVFSHCLYLYDDIGEIFLVSKSEEDWMMFQIAQRRGKFVGFFYYY